MQVEDAHLRGVRQGLEHGVALHDLVGHTLPEVRAQVSDEVVFLGEQVDVEVRGRVVRGPEGDGEQVA